MVKTNKFKSCSKAENLYSKKLENKLKPSNPFEVQTNREKFSVLGRISKDAKGRPGIARGKAMKKRAQTIGKEFINRHKTNHFNDNRIGNGVHQSNEELLNKRLTAERVSQFQSRKKNIFNLNEDLVLTHKGQTLEEIEHFYSEASDDESDDGKLDGKSNIVIIMIINQHYLFILFRIHICINIEPRRSIYTYIKPSINIQSRRSI